MPSLKGPLSPRRTQTKRPPENPARFNQRRPELGLQPLALQLLARRGPGHQSRFTAGQEGILPTGQRRCRDAKLARDSFQVLSAQEPEHSLRPRAGSQITQARPDLMIALARPAASTPGSPPSVHPPTLRRAARAAAAPASCSDKRLSGRAAKRGRPRPDHMACR